MVWQLIERNSEIKYVIIEGSLLECLIYKLMHFKARLIKGGAK